MRDTRYLGFLGGYFFFIKTNTDTEIRQLYMHILDERLVWILKVLANVYCGRRQGGKSVIYEPLYLSLENQWHFPFFMAIYRKTPHGLLTSCTSEHRLTLGQYKTTDRRETHKNLCWMEIKIWIVKKTLIVLLKAMAYFTKEKTRVRKIWHLKLHPRLAKTKFTLCFSLMSLKWPNWNRNELNPTNQKTRHHACYFLVCRKKKRSWISMSHHFINVITAAFGYCTKTEPDAVSQCFSPISFHSSVWMRINKP